MKAKKEFNNIILGIILLLVIHSAVFVVLKILASLILLFNSVLAASIILPFFYIGLFQIFYVIPLVIWLKRKQQPGRIKGVIIGAIITFLLNISYFGSLLLSFR